MGLAARRPSTLTFWPTLTCGPSPPPAATHTPHSATTPAHEDFGCSELVGPFSCPAKEGTEEACWGGREEQTSVWFHRSSLRQGQGQDGQLAQTQLPGTFRAAAMSMFGSVSKGRSPSEGWKSCSLPRHLGEGLQLTGGCPPPSPYPHPRALHQFPSPTPTL